MELKVTKRVQACQRWRTLDSTRFRWRRIPGRDIHSRDFHLIPGGRWLFENVDGQGYIADLTAPTITWNLLLDERQYDGHGKKLDPLGGSAIWIDPSKPWLSVRVALHNVSTAETLGKV